LDSEEKLKGKIYDLEADYDELKEKHEGMEVELEDLKGCIIQEHINDFHKGLRQTTFFCKDLDMSDSRNDVNKDVVDGQLISEVESSHKEQLKKVAVADENKDGELKQLELHNGYSTHVAYLW